MPMLGLGLGLHKTNFPIKPILNQLPTSATAYSLRKLRSGVTNAIRVRDDTNTETNIGFSGNDLDTTGLTNWLERDLVESKPLGVDVNMDGVSDGWTTFTASNITATRSIEDSAQKITLTGGTTTVGNGAEVRTQINAVAGSIITFSCYVKKDIGDTEVRLSLPFFNSSGVFIFFSSTGALTNTEYELITLTATAPANTASFSANLRIVPTVIGATGSAWFKDATVTISNQSAYVTTWYDQSGNGNHATQSTADNQPRIVNQGIIDRDFDTTKANDLYPTFASASEVNIVSNGDFSNGTDGWILVGATGSVSSNIFSLVGDGTNTFPTMIKDTSDPIVVGKRYFVRAKVKVTNAVCSSIIIALDGTTGGSSINTARLNTPTQDTVYTLSGIGVVGSDFTGNVSVRIFHNYVDNSTANGKVMEVQEVVCVDITELGNPTIQTILANDTRFVVPHANSLNISTNMTASVVHTPSNIGESSLGRMFNKNNAPNLSLTATTKFSCNGVNSLDSCYTLSSNNINTITFDSGANQTIFYTNGVSNRSTTASVLTPNTNDMILFNISDGSRQYDGKISELILFSITLSDTQRKKLELSQSKYYGITLI